MRFGFFNDLIATWLNDLLELDLLTWYGMVWYSSIYLAPLNSRGPTEALLVRLAPRKETSFEK